MIQINPLRRRSWFSHVEVQKGNTTRIMCAKWSDHKWFLHLIINENILTLEEGIRWICLPMALIRDTKSTRLCTCLTSLPLPFCRLDSSKRSKGTQAAYGTGTPSILSMHFVPNQVSCSNQYQFLFPYARVTSGYYFFFYLLILWK